MAAAGASPADAESAQKSNTVSLSATVSIEAPLAVATAAAGPHGDVVSIHRPGLVEVRSGGTLSWRNNNPGNIRAGDYTATQGQIGRNEGFAVFPDLDSGRAALANLFKGVDYRDLTIGQAVDTYSPKGDGRNDPRSYLEGVLYYMKRAGVKGVVAGTRLAALTELQFDAFVDSVKDVEVFHHGHISFVPLSKPRPATPEHAKHRHPKTRRPAKPKATP